LNGEIALLRAVGEPMSIEELMPSHLPDAENASQDYKAPGQLVDEKQPVWKKWYDSDSSKGEFHPPFTADEVTTMHAIVASNQASLQIVARARGKMPGDWGDQFVRPYMLSTEKFNYKTERALADLLRIAAFAAHADGRDREAVEHLGDMLRLEEAALKRPTLIGHLVAVGIDTMTSETVWQIAPDLRVGATGADSAAVTDLIHRLEEESALRDGRRLCWRSDRICALDTYQSIMDGTLASGQSNAPSDSSRLLTVGYLVKPLILDDDRLMLIHLQGIEQAADAPDWPAAEGLMPTDLPHAIQANPKLHLLSSLLLPGFERCMHMDYRAGAERRLAAGALAMRLYAIDHDGRLPGRLEDLVPTYLPAVPIDPLSGRSILYKTDAVRPRIYSVGDDGVDDGGIEQDRSLGSAKYGDKGDLVVNLKIQPRPVDEQSN